MQVINVSNPASLIREGGLDISAAAARDIAVSGGYVYLVGRAGLQVIDVSNPAKAVRIGSCDLGGGGRVLGEVSVSGDYAYVAGARFDGAWNSFFGVIDVSNPANPQPVGGFDTSGETSGLTASGNYVYLMHSAGLDVIDVSDPAHPVRVGSYVAEYAQGVAISGSYAYLAQVGRDGWSAERWSLHVIDVSNPARPAKVGYYTTSGRAVGLSVAEGYAYVAGVRWVDDEPNAGLQVIDVRDPVHPVYVGGFEASGYPCGMEVSGNRVYLADERACLQVIDVSNPAQPLRVGVGGYYTRGIASGVAFSGAYAYVADRDNTFFIFFAGEGLVVFDVSDPTNPVRVSSYDTEGSAQAVAVSENFAYVADSDAGLQIIDVRDPAKPFRVGGYATGGPAWHVAVSGRYAYVVWGWTGDAAEEYDRALDVIDISDPINPKRVGSYDIRGPAPRHVAVSGHSAYVAVGQAGLQIFEIIELPAFTQQGVTARWQADPHVE